MNIEEVVEMSADQLEKMTDAELEKYFSAYLIVTRPESSPHNKAKEQQTLLANPQFEKARQVAATIGISLPVFTSMRKRKQ
jgi:hypothetical protein